MNTKNTIIASAAALVAIIAVSGFAFGSFAADTSNSSSSASSDTGKARGFGKMMSEEKIAQFEAEREERQTAMQNALNKGYDAWVAYVKEEMGEDAPILDKVNASNFARFKEAHDLMAESRTIMEELGIEGKGMGMGFGMGMKMGKMKGMMHGGDCPMMNQ